MHANQTYEGTLQNTMEPIGIVVDWLKTNSGKIILLIVVALLAAVIDKALTRIVSKVLDRSQVPNASIFINILRAVVWTLAVGTVLQPVFGINPTTIFTALGIGGLAVSLGMKDTIANIIGGHRWRGRRYQLASDRGARAQWQRQDHSEFDSEHRVTGKTQSVQ